MKQRAATTRALRVFLGSCGERSPCLKKHNIYEGIVPFTVCIFFLVLVFFPSLVLVFPPSLACYRNEKINSENYNWMLELKYFVQYLEMRINQTYNEKKWKSEGNFGAYIESSKLFLVKLGNHMR